METTNNITTNNNNKKYNKTITIVLKNVIKQ